MICPRCRERNRFKVYVETPTNILYRCLNCGFLFVDLELRHINEKIDA